MIQCHRQSSYCFCVNLLNGKPIPGTSLKNQKPNCFKFLQQLKRRRRPRRGEQQNQQKCKSEDEQVFTRNLIMIFVSELKRVKQRNVTKEESIEWKFSDLDTNNDNKLSKKELKHFRRMIVKIIRPMKCAQQFLRNCDSNKNQLIE
ncbi:Sparc-related modular calcium-binding protein 1-like protein, partial [Leptotrombidium deliense]